MLLHGIFPPITTPFYPDGKIYFRKLEQNVEQYSRAPIAGIVVQGSTGEAILLSDEERREVLSCAREAAANDKVLIAGTGIESAIETLAPHRIRRTTRLRRRHGAHAALLQRPDGEPGEHAGVLSLRLRPLAAAGHHLQLSAGDRIRHSGGSRDRTWPSIPTSIAIKESSGSIEKVQKMVEGTRHIKRSATVTETFAAVTGRMLKAAVSAAQLTPMAARWSASAR